MMLHHVCDTQCQYASFAAASTGFEQDRPDRRSHGGLLFGIQASQVVHRWGIFLPRGEGLEQRCLVLWWGIIPYRLVLRQYRCQRLMEQMQMSR